MPVLMPLRASLEPSVGSRMCLYMRFSPCLGVEASIGPLQRPGLISVKRRPPAAPTVAAKEVVMYKHILISTDGSATAEKAVKAGLDFAKWAKAKVTVFTAMP